MSKIESVKNHVREHKKVYIVGGAVAVVCVAAGAGYAFGVRTTPKNVETLVAPSNTIKGLAWKPNQTIEVIVEALGDPGNIVQDLNTGTIYASQGQAARELGVNASRISEHLAGKLPNVKGHKLVKLGKACVPQVGSEAIA